MSSSDLRDFGGLGDTIGVAEFSEYVFVLIFSTPLVDEGVLNEKVVLGVRFGRLCSISFCSCATDERPESCTEGLLKSGAVMGREKLWYWPMDGCPKQDMGEGGVRCPRGSERGVTGEVGHPADD